MNLKKNIKELEKYGITFLPNMYSKKECKEYINTSENIIKKFIKKKLPMAPDCQQIENPFRHNSKYLDLCPIQSQIQSNPTEMLGKTTENSWVGVGFPLYLP